MDIFSSFCSFHLSFFFLLLLLLLLPGMSLMLSCFYFLMFSNFLYQFSSTSSSSLFLVPSHASTYPSYTPASPPSPSWHSCTRSLPKHRTVTRSSHSPHPDTPAHPFSTVIIALLSLIISLFMYQTVICNS